MFMKKIVIYDLIMMTIMKHVCPLERSFVHFCPSNLIKIVKPNTQPINLAVHITYHCFKKYLNFLLVYAFFHEMSHF